jgi:hypothetical protein
MKKYILIFIAALFPFAVKSSNVGGERKQLEKIRDKGNFN